MKPSTSHCMWPWLMHPVLKLKTNSITQSDSKICKLLPCKYEYYIILINYNVQSLCVYFIHTLILSDCIVQNSGKRKISEFSGPSIDIQQVG